MKKDAVLRTLAAVGGLALMAGFIGWMSTRDRDPRTLRYWEKRLPDSISDARAAGMWTSLGEIKEEPPAGTNGAPRLVVSAAAFEAAGLDKASSYSWLSMQVEGTKRSEAQADIAKFRILMPDIAAALQGDYFAWEPGPGFPEIYRTWRLVDAYVNAVSVDAVRGDAKELRPAFRGAARMSRALLDSGYAEGLRRGMMMRERSMRCLLTLARNSEISDGELRELAGFFRPEPISLQHSMRYDFCDFRRSDDRMHFGPWYEFMIAPDPAQVPEWQYYLRAPWPAVERAGRSASLHYWTTMWPEMAKPLPQIARMPDRTVIEFGRSDFWPITDVLDNGLPRFAERLVRDDAKCAVQSAAVEIELHRRRHGAYPALLPKSGSIFTDPWTGKPLGYRTVGPHFLVWSVGPNGIDEKGHDRGSTPRGDDITYSSEKEMTFG